MLAPRCGYLPAVKPKGRYKFASRHRTYETTLDPSVRSERRVRRIVNSLRDEILEGGGEGLRIRRVFTIPREIFRLELELPELAYQRITLLDRETLEQLLESEDVRARLESSPLAG
jgi:hypothetical protein